MLVLTHFGTNRFVLISLFFPSKCNFVVFDSLGNFFKYLEKSKDLFCHPLELLFTLSTEDTAAWQGATFSLCLSLFLTQVTAEAPHGNFTLTPHMQNGWGSFFQQTYSYYHAPKFQLNLKWATKPKQQKLEVDKEAWTSLWMWSEANVKTETKHSCTTSGFYAKS